jgi:hypothetical protein
MTEFQINDHIFGKECDELALEIFDEYMTSAESDETAEDKRDDMTDSAHQTADGHEWVIYNHKALMICAHCDVDQGEAFLEEIGMPEDVTIHKLACTIVYGEMLARISAKLDELIDDWEPAEA